jgi:hypothetical protein
MIVVTVRSNFDLLCTSHTLAGLFSLGEKIAIRTDDRINTPHVMRIDDGGMRMLVDLSDHSDEIDEDGLAWCTVYAKRNVETISDPKIAPFGLNYNGRGTYSALRAALASGDLKRSIRLFRTPHWKSFERAPSVPADNVVLLQTRLWEANTCPGDEHINDERIELVNTLKKHLGDRFRGGIIPTDASRNLNPWLLSNNPTTQGAYVAWTKSCKIAVYTRGLFGSIGFKLPEYLAGSKCVVSAPITNLLPVALQDGEQIRVYTSPEECVAHCDRLLSENSEADRLAQAAWDYYRKNVEPTIHIRTLLGRA